MYEIWFADRHYLPKKGTSANLTPEVKLRLSVRHLDNRYNVITLRRWSNLDEIRRRGAEWHPNTVIWSKSKPEVEFQNCGRLLLSSRN